MMYGTLTIQFARVHQAMARYHYLQGDYSESFEHELSAHQIYKRLLGDSDIHTLFSYKLLAKVCLAMGNLPLYQINATKFAKNFLSGEEQ
jgi:hypothetical protein